MTTTPAPATPTPCRILVVEDELIVSADLQDRLSRLGYKVAGAASTGEDAVKKAVDLHPDIVLMDIILKGDMDGIEAAALVKQRCQIPVIFLTANSNDMILERAKVTEPFGYLLKPFEQRHLKMNIDIAVYKSRLERERAQLLRELQDALARVKTLSGLLPICAWCKNVRDDEGYWKSVESYVQSHTDARFSHCLCPECMEKHFPAADQASPPAAQG